MFLLVSAHPGFLGKNPKSRKTVLCVCVCLHYCKLCGKVSSMQIAGLGTRGSGTCGTGTAVLGHAELGQFL